MKEKQKEFRDDLLGKHSESDSKKPFDDENRPKRLSDDDDLL